jgi:hypothetical protein
MMMKGSCWLWTAPGSGTAGAMTGAEQCSGWQVLPAGACVPARSSSLASPSTQAG